MLEDVFPGTVHNRTAEDCFLRGQHFEGIGVVDLGNAVALVRVGREERFEVSQKQRLV
jgi:hypothetical protein